MPYIGQKPHNKVVTASEISDGIITADKLASDSVTTAKIADNGVTTAKINADAVTDAKIADDVVGTEHLTAGEVDTTALGADAVTAAKIADNAISEEHLDATIITGLTALTSAPADTDELLISDAGTLKRIDVSLVGGDNTPAFSAYLSSNQAIADQTITKIIFQSESFDTDSAYNTSDGVFTVPSGEGGKYHFQFSIRKSNWNTQQAQMFIRVNDGSSDVDFAIVEDGDQQGDNNTLTGSIIITMSAGHTAAVYYYQDGGANAPLRTGGTSAGGKQTFFSGYKLIGL